MAAGVQLVLVQFGHRLMCSCCKAFKSKCALVLRTSGWMAETSTQSLSWKSRGTPSAIVKLTSENPPSCAPLPTFSFQCLCATEACAVQAHCSDYNIR